MRVVVYDDTGDIACSYDLHRDPFSLCSGRLEKAQVVEALQEAAFFILNGPAPAPESRTFRQNVFEGLVANAVGVIARILRPRIAGVMNPAILKLARIRRSGQARIIDIRAPAPGRKHRNDQN